jgi:hypothetical protein
MQQPISRAWFKRIMAGADGLVVNEWGVHSPAPSLSRGLMLAATLLGEPVWLGGVKPGTDRHGFLVWKGEK